ncbi:MAG TPA: DUF1543 domain-containing protein [Candidatus Krumholzibacteria bacterium]|nr:DUF1543 domain-containing protein [Candidatus Krumholzibacteria bacterium]
MKLFAVMLGGNAPKSHTELHDMVFTCGERLEDTWDQMLDQWFGAPDGLHVDSWGELERVDGHRVALRPEPQDGRLRLWFINLGAYRAGHFGELHAVAFLVDDDPARVKARAKAALLPGTDELHTDDLHEVDDCLPVERVGGLHVHLVADPAAAGASPHPRNGWLPLPAEAIAAWKARR